MVYLQGRAEAPTTARPLAAAFTEPTSRMRDSIRTLALRPGDVNAMHIASLAVIDLAPSPATVSTSTTNGRDDGW